ncbi:hypothetical protein FHS39_000737 [Streptomyces olivoverticillatus]|uniref:DUF7691 domain-containing protein n=1 Tax=Streptomyces olivoverticillatus TaxID=66427 RepID=A0A7W7PJ40_9ACTN|nr:hypothetical protein [Streptomyces olivoverticillatus]MBB4891737.1 hypothetical protein [Streptomyces olivoverticillatus]
MSYGLSLYAVDLTLARGAIGCGSKQLLDMIGKTYGQHITRDDEYFAYEIAKGAPTGHEALRAVVEGGPFDKEHAFQYGYAYKRICEAYGDRLDGNSFSPFRSAWLMHVDEGLTSLGMTAVSVSPFMYSLPRPLPRAELPGYGEWTPEQCAQGLAQWEASTDEQRQRLDFEVLEAIESCVGWMRQARSKEGYGIAGFGS